MLTRQVISRDCWDIQTVAVSNLSTAKLPFTGYLQPKHQDLLKNQWQMLDQNLHLNLFLKGKPHCQVPCSNKSATVSAYFKSLC